MIRIQRGISVQQMPFLQEIFFLSSTRQEFASEEEKEHFFKKWTHYYFEFARDWVFLALEDSGKIQGYLTGCPNSEMATPFFQKVNEIYALFVDQFQRFPAHLHINCHPDARGKGYGRRLISEFTRELREIKVPGVHIVTSPDARNRDFYLQNGFNVELARKWKEHPLLFMGRDL